MTHEAARDRIRKLLNMTVDSGCTEDEADTALRLASGLAAKLGIELDELRPAGSPKPKIVEDWSWQKMKPYEAYAAHAAAVLYGVRCYAPNLGKTIFGFVGRQENIELAEDTMLWIVRQIDLLYKAALPKGLSQRDRREFRGSFKDAAAVRVYERARELVRQMKEDETFAQEVTGRNALTVKGHFDKLEQEIVDHYAERSRRQAEEHRRWAEANPEAAKAAERATRQRNRRPRKGRKGRSIRQGWGTHQGYQAGDQVHLRKEVEE